MELALGGFSLGLQSVVESFLRLGGVIAFSTHKATQVELRHNRSNVMHIRLQLLIHAYELRRNKVLILHLEATHIQATSQIHCFVMFPLCWTLAFEEYKSTSPMTSNVQRNVRAHLLVLLLCVLRRLLLQFIDRASVGIAVCSYCFLRATGKLWLPVPLALLLLLNLVLLVLLIILTLAWLV
jgi:hypothetical protein